MGGELLRLVALRGPELAGSKLGIGLVPRTALATMASLARTLLTSSGPHRNVSRVFGAQLRCLHGTAEKPVFHWEVSRPQVV